MTKRLGKTQSYRIKQLVFVLVLLLVFTAILALIFFKDQVLLFVLSSLLTLVLIFLVTRYDFLLTLKEYERAVVFRFGRVVRVGGPGWALVIPVIESFRIVDLRSSTIDIPAQEVITKDSVVIKIDAIIYLFVKKDNQSVINSVIEIDDYRKGAEQFVVASIRDSVGELTLQEVISSIDKLNVQVQKRLSTIAINWGVNVDSVEIQNIKLPKELQDALTHQKAAEQEKLARIEKAKAHSAEIEAVREAAEHLSDKAIAYYYVRALERLGQGKSTKFIFPMELTRLAESISGAKSGGEVEALMKKYAPVVKKLVDNNKEE